MSSSISGSGLTVAYTGAPALDDVSIGVEPGTVTAVIGPNGCGKSTLLRTLARLQKPDAGVVTLDGTVINRLPSRLVAQRMGVLPQSPTAPDGLSVLDLVARGRDPHRRWYDQWSARDEEISLAALARCGLLDLAARELESLSGGQRQRAWIAMALAQEPQLLLLDEPTTYLDVVHQIEVLDLLRSLHTEAGTTVVMVLHDLSLAARYANRIVAMRTGRVVADGGYGDVITPEVLARVFDLDCDVVSDPRTGRPVVLPHGRAVPAPGQDDFPDRTR
ncbi:ABC transporter ATP-binding protein [Kineosporia sp. NBRC 101731]|uniref:ABC transporter ATP-binding protein n=1 Tax=Kineosporia sp. NBRC 101731 TaxID=3032199 RepID=UPI0024A53769|nr:ABC transporter ATP-binding protein [Kineosporia sp. NBRC 101731]GLY31618.1 cobalamin/Fe3+-siderophore ABC transporter ATP-binding protein [Kineosporia sp. NBRC 101731]